MNICRHGIPVGLSAVLRQQERQGSKVKTDWIKAGVGDSFDANSNQLILF